MNPRCLSYPKTRRALFSKACRDMKCISSPRFLNQTDAYDVASAIRQSLGGGGSEGGGVGEVAEAV